MKFILATLAAILLMAPSATLWANPLRIWVMHNEIGARKEPVTSDAIHEFIRTKRERDNILIENNVQNLLMDDALDEAYPLANYVLGENKFLDELEAFRRNQPDIGPIAVEFIRWNDAFSKISGVTESNGISNAPDVIQIGSTWVATFADRGILTNLSDYFDTNDFFPPSIASARVFGDEGLFAVPWFVDTRLLFYWKKDIRSPSQIADWQSFLSTCKKASRTKPGSFIGFPNTISWDLLHNLAPWLWAGGGDILTPNRWGPIHGHRVALDSPSSLAGILYLKSLAETGCVGFPTVGHVELENRFIEGRYSTIITGPWLVKRLGDTWPEHIGVALPPAGPKGAHPFVGGSHLAITTSSLQRGNFHRAIALVRHFASPAAQQTYAEATGLLPAHRGALKHYTGRADTSVFLRALENGISYPSIPEWGSVVENDLIRNHIWHIWHDIAHTVSYDALRNTVHRVAGEMRKKLVLALATRHAPAAATILGIVAFVGIGVLLIRRRRYRHLLRQFEKTIAVLKTKVLQRPMRQKHIGDFTISGDGRFHLRGEEIHFENNRQARRLIEHMVRQACQGITTTHCLWGYPLFGWNPEQIKSTPQRLFEIMVSKINRRLKALGAPPLIKKAGKKSGSWTFMWDMRAIIDNSDIGRAKRMMDVPTPSDQEAFAALQLDPKNFEALEQLANSHHMNAPWKISKKLLEQDLASLRNGTNNVEGMIRGETLHSNIDRDTANSEYRSMKHHVEYVGRTLEHLFGKQGDEKQPHLVADVARQMSAVQRDIAALKSREVIGQHLWASVIDSESFGRLVAIPRVQSMVNNFYNRETREHEDPRLIQLAMALVLSSPQSSNAICASSNENDLFDALERGLRQQLKDLELGLSAMPITS